MSALSNYKSQSGLNASSEHSNALSIGGNHVPPQDRIHELVTKELSKFTQRLSQESAMRASAEKANQQKLQS